MKIITLIIPCFNEQESLPVFYDEITKIMRINSFEYELIFVNDGSSDNTLSILKELSNKDTHVIYLSFSRNFGKEAAMYAGFCNAHGDYAVVMDADMQDPPYLIPEMLKILESGNYDCVATCRKNRIGEPVVRSWFAKKFYKIINKISDYKIMEGARDFRIMRREMLNAVCSMTEYNRFSKGIFSWVGFRTYWLKYENVERTAGKTKWNFWSLLKYATDGIVNFSQVPLSLASWGGIFMTVFSFIMLVVIVARKILFGDPVAGWASVICSMIFLGGVQLFCLGITGQYIAKIYLESKRRPHFIISETNRDDIKKIQ